MHRINRKTHLSIHRDWDPAAALGRYMNVKIVTDGPCGTVFSFIRCSGIDSECYKGSPLTNSKYVR